MQYFIAVIGLKLQWNIWKYLGLICMIKVTLPPFFSLVWFYPCLHHLPPYMFFLSTKTGLFSPELHFYMKFYPSTSTLYNEKFCLFSHTSTMFYGIFCLFPHGVFYRSLPRDESNFIIKYIWSIIWNNQQTLFSLKFFF